MIRNSILNENKRMTHELFAAHLLKGSLSAAISLIEPIEEQIKTMRISLKFENIESFQAVCIAH